MRHRNDEPISPRALGGGAELDWHLMRWLRLDALVAATMLASRDGSAGDGAGLSTRAAMQLLAGADGVLPMGWGELFAGALAGTTYTDARAGLAFRCLSCAAPASSWRPTVRLRSGVDFAVAGPLLLGVELAYTLFPTPGELAHWFELRGRAAIAF